MRTDFPLTTIIKKFEGKATPADEQELQQWLGKDQANAAILTDIKTIWDDVQSKTAGYTPDVNHYWELMQRHISKESYASILPKRFRTRMKTFLSTAAVACGLLLGGTLVAWLLFMRPDTPQPSELTYTAIDGKSRLVLPDSSIVWLNANSRLVYTNASNDIREVKLEGEAFFNVTASSTPFVVRTGALTVTVHGTQFNVDAYADCATATVSLYEGSVSMQSDAENAAGIFLKPGEEGCFHKDNGTISVAPADVELAKAWTGDKLKVENKNLREVCSYLAEWYGVEITIDPHTPNDQSYTFTLDDQSLDEVMGILNNISAINYTYENDKSIIITP